MSARASILGLGSSKDQVVLLQLPVSAGRRVSVPRVSTLDLIYPLCQQQRVRDALEGNTSILKYKQ